MNKTMVKLGDICNIQSGGTPARKNLSYWQNGKIPWAKISDFSGKYTNFTEEKITDEGLANSSAKIFKKGTVLYSIYATLGETTILNIDAATNQAIVGFDIKDHNVFSEYLYYSLLSLKEYVKFIGRGTTQNNININILRNLEIPIVPLETQQKIVAKLDNLNLAIDKCKRLLELHDELIKSKFYEMFGEEKYNKVIMSEVTSIITDGTHQPPSFQDSGIPFIFVSNISNNEVTYNAEKFINAETYQQLYKRTPIEIGDILLSSVGSYGHPAIVKSDRKFLFQRHIAYLKPIKDKIDSIYLHRAILSDNVQAQIKKSVKGAVQKTLNLSEIKKLSIPLPPLSLQTQFAQYVETVESSKTKIKELQSRIEYLKASYMQEFFA